MTGVLGIDHIAVAVEDLDAATRLWRDALGLRVGRREVVPDQGAEVQMLYAGETRIELLRPLGPEGPVARFLAKRGPGLHHLAVAVEDCAAALEAARAAGARPVQEEPAAGAHGTRVGFLHPASLNGVLAELVQGGEGPWSREEPS